MLRKLWNSSRNMSNEEKAKEKNGLTLFDNQRKPDHSGFITLTFNGGIEMDSTEEATLDGSQYLYIVNGFSPTTASTSSSLVKSSSYRQTEFMLIEEDVDRYIKFMKDVAAYYTYLQEFTKQANSAKSILLPSLKLRADIINEKKKGGPEPVSFYREESANTLETKKKKKSCKEKRNSYELNTKP